MNERIKVIRKKFNLNQEEFAVKIGLNSKGHISSIENGTRKLTDRNVADICEKFNISEHWLRTGEGDMDAPSDSFTLDEYAKKKNVTPLEIEILKSFIDLDEQLRAKVLAHLMSVYVKQGNVKNVNSEFSEDNDIEAELADYRIELEAEKKGQLASPKPAEKETKIAKAK